MHCRGAHRGGRRKTVVVARLLLGPSTTKRGRVAQTRLSHRLHRIERDTQTWQAMGCMVCISHSGAWIVRQARLCWDEPWWRVCLHLGGREHDEGFRELCG